MASHASPKKRSRRDKKFNVINNGRVQKVRTYTKKVEKIIETKDKEQAPAALKKLQSEMMRLVSKGNIPLNRASRKISRLQKHINAFSAAT